MIEFINDDEIKPTNIKVLGKNFANEPTEGADMIIASVESGEVAAVADKIDGSEALKVLITDAKTEACAKFDTFIISADAEKIINSFKNMLGMSGLVNLDFSDVEMFLKNAGEAYALFGSADNSLDAAKNAIGDGVKLKSARNILLHMTGGAGTSMPDTLQAMTIIQYKADPTAEILWSLSIDESLGNKFEVAMIASRFIDED